MLYLLHVVKWIIDSTSAWRNFIPIRDSVVKKWRTKVNEEMSTHILRHEVSNCQLFVVLIKVLLRKVSKHFSPKIMLISNWCFHRSLSTNVWSSSNIVKGHSRERSWNDLHRLGRRSYRSFYLELSTRA